MSKCPVNRTIKDCAATEVPWRLALAPKDERGLVIPYFVRPTRPDIEWDFRVLSDRTFWCADHSLCGICGDPLDDPTEFQIGGDSSCAHLAFGDPSMHEECARYAMQACPFISNENVQHSKPGAIQILHEQIGGETTRDDGYMFLVESTVYVPIAGYASDAVLSRPIWHGLSDRHVRSIEMWLNGEMVASATGDYVHEYLKALRGKMGADFHPDQLSKRGMGMMITEEVALRLARRLGIEG